MLAPVGRAELAEDERLDVAQVVRDVRTRGRRAAGPLPIDDIVAQVAREARSGDAVVLLSNGAFGGIHARLATALADAPR